MDFILWHDGKELGPYDADSLRNSIESGDVPPKTLARLASGGDWKPLEMLLPAPKVLKENTEAPKHADPTARTVNKGARMLSYALILAAAVLLVFGVGSMSKSPAENAVLASWMEVAPKAIGARAFLNQNEESLRQALAVGDRETATRVLKQLQTDVAVIQQDDSNLAEIAKLAAERKTRMIIQFGIGGFLLLVGAIIRVYS